EPSSLEHAAMQSAKVIAPKRTEFFIFCSPAGFSRGGVFLRFRAFSHGKLVDTCGPILRQLLASLENNRHFVRVDSDQ
ncbi:MAG: hypothetical protein ACKVJN_00745, partial [Woeseiales bacterium]